MRGILNILGEGVARMGRAWCVRCGCNIEGGGSGGQWEEEEEEEEEDTGLEHHTS